MPIASFPLICEAQPPGVAAQRVVVIDPRDGAILFERNADLPEQVASTQKLLTALVLLEKDPANEQVEIVPEDLDCLPMKCGLEVGDEVSRRDLLAAMLVRSANDAAQALARSHSGSLPEFADAMNDRAAQLGMAQSHFVNPHGLPDDRQFSSARDMARLAVAVDAVPWLREIVSRPAFTLRRDGSEPLLLENTNRLLTSFPGCDGMKTGFTKRAGHCLISSGERAGRRRIVVLLNSTREAVWKDSAALLEWSFSQ